MRIQRIFTQKQNINNQQRQRFQKINFGNNEFDDNIKVREIDYKGSKIPYVYMEKKSSNRTDNKDIENSLKLAFRDDELFDNKKDVVDFTYYHYDDNDVVSQKPILLSASDDYLLSRKIKTNRNKDFEVDITYPQYLYKKIEVEKDPFDYTKLLPPTQKSKLADIYRTIDKMSYLKKGIKDIYSFEISEYLLDMYKKNCSLSDMKEILPFTKSAEYYDCKKSMIFEEFSSFYIDKYFELKENKKIENVKEYKKILNFLKTGHRGYADLVIDMVTDLSQNASLEKILDIFNKQDCRVYSETNKEECYNLILKVLGKTKK